jgi:hypothetical protein
MQGTVSAKVENRLARKQQGRGRALEALAAFANLGEGPEQWRKFHLLWPEFFPTSEVGLPVSGFRSISEWLYKSAGEWASFPPDIRACTKPPLLWYRDCLRSVWLRNDPNGAYLSVLLGLEKQAEALGIIDRIPVVRPLLIPGQPTDPDKQQSRGLPQGQPWADGVTGEIGWRFGCGLQQAVYDLMQSRWRARVCPECGRYFIAGKTAQTFCSTRCAGEMKRKRALEWWHREGTAQRHERAKQETKSTGRRK